MSTAFYTGLRAKAGALITSKGKAVTLRVPTVTTPVQPYRPVTTYVNYTAQAVVTEFKADQIDGTLVQSGDRKYLIAAEGLGAVPSPKHLIVDGSEILEILSVMRTSPGGLDVIYTAHCRPTGGNA